VNAGRGGLAVNAGSAGIAFADLGSNVALSFVTLGGGGISGGNIHTDGGADRAGGAVQLTATGATADIVVGSITTTGGAATAGAGSNAGGVTLHAGRNLSVGAVTATGSAAAAGSGGNGGAGGAVSLTADTGTVTLRGDLLSRGGAADGAGTGGAGGAITISGDAVLASTAASFTADASGAGTGAGG
jgi:hypothetical protein